MRIQGYHGTGVKDIVAAAGIPKGSFYNYFDSKEDFVIEALQQVAEGNLTQIRRTLAEPGQSPLNRLRSVFSGGTEYLKRHGRYECGSFLGMVAQEVADTNETVRSVTQDLLESYQATLAACLSEAQSAGEIDPGLDCPSLAGFIFSAWEGALLQMKARKSPAPLDDFLFWLDRVLSSSRA